MNQRSFKEMLQASFKSNDTEEWLDVHFTRPIGLVFALFWNKLGVHPNAITILSIFLGIGAGYMFYFTDLWHNVAGVVLLMLANFCDSTDGQMARLTGKKTLVGRVLDGFSGDVWFFCIYFALCCRMMGQNIPGTNLHWGIAIWVLAFIAGVLCHSPQSSLADYYRQIHLFFLKGKEGSELDNYAQQRAVYDNLPREQWFARLFYYNYANYCKSQEKRTPKFQEFFSLWKEKSEAGVDLTETKTEFLNGSRPLMKYTNILTFNVRAICIYVTCLLNCPWVYMLIEILILSVLYIYMHREHEQLCERLTEKIGK
ncbi:MAG: CDP-alcohol phosphatidyltransferase family protein [Prevotella sp.]|nr:CDP-alcohol phosphatidyltransferase family protein [Prevotella sp.]